ncbi:hypothetical protein Y032_0136g1978 [Ancylostoma ceylanicum]|uniref:Uncharacterized protein n=1 Tax=Ancylostoma ceylanicum TaxID=53326 RepID=A0A016T5C3_9BILA|nr:hypothetical protein Y032_0136g1978 [Ancylostoma ceylanicum]
MNVPGQVMAYPLFQSRRVFRMKMGTICWNDSSQSVNAVGSKSSKKQYILVEKLVHCGEAVCSEPSWERSWIWAQLIYTRKKLRSLVR